MDPAKRICLKNLPADCTKREIAELIRNRTGAQPHSIDLGLDANGSVRRYAHFSCEGAKGVLEILQSGVALREETIFGFPAEPHFSFVLAEARRKRERDEEAEREQLEAHMEDVKQRCLARTHGGELRKTRIPKLTVFSVKAKYGSVAAEIAKRLREAHRQKKGHAPSSSSHRPKKFASAPSAGGAEPTADSAAAAAGDSRGRGTAPNRAGPSPRSSRKAAKGATPAAAAAPAAPPPPPPQPTKEEKKLSGLQARLAALKEKLKKS